MMNPRNIPLLCDYYEYTMGNGYMENGLSDRIVYFDIFFRRVPDNGGFAIAAGLEQLISYITELRFDESDIEFMRSKGIFGERFLEYLKDFHFTGDIYAVPEGTPVFPGEPVVTIRANAIEAQILETFALLTINHQTLIATKSSRIVRAAEGRTVLEFGSRRAQGGNTRCEGSIHRRLWRYGMYCQRQVVRSPCKRNNGPLMGADVPNGIRCVHGIL